MNPLLKFEESHPSGTGLIGVASGLSTGLLAWIAANSAEITSVAATVGTFCAATLSVIALLAKLVNYSRAATRFIRDTAHNRRQRRLARQLPPEDPDDLPF